MARASTFPLSSVYGGVQYRTAPPAWYNLRLRDILGDTDSRQKLDWLAAIHLRVNSWRIQANCTFGGEATATFPYGPCADTNGNVPDVTYTSTFSANTTLDYTHVMALPGNAAFSPDYYTPGQLPLRFTEWLFASRFDAQFPLNTNVGILTPYIIAVGPTNATDDQTWCPILSRSGSFSWTQEFSGGGSCDPYSDSGSYHGETIGGVKYYAVAFESAAPEIDPPEGSVPRSPLVNLFVVPRARTFDIYAQVVVTINVKTTVPPPFPILEAAARFSTDRSRFSNPMDVGECRITIPAFDFGASPVTGGPALLKFPIYTALGSYGQSADIAIAPGTNNRSNFHPYGLNPLDHSKYTHIDPVWDNSGTPVKHPVTLQLL